MISDIIELIFSNLFIVIIILGGLMSFFKENKKQKEAAEKRRNERKTTQTSQPLPGRMETNRPTQSRQQKSTKEKQAPSMKSIEEQRAEQLKRLRRTVSTIGNNEHTDQHKIPKDIEKGLLRTQTKSRSQHQTPFQKKLTRTGLMDSIVMAEILDKPKSLRPHHPSYKKY